MYKNQRPNPYYEIEEQSKDLRVIGEVQESGHSRNFYNNKNQNEMQLLTRNVTYNLTKNVLKTQNRLTSSLCATALLQPTTPSAANSKRYYSGEYKQKLLHFPAFPLGDTITRFLRSVEPLLTQNEFAKTSEEAYKFLQGDGAQLQTLLEAQASNMNNWLAPRWLRTAYLQYRDPVTVYSSPGMSFPVQKFNSYDDCLLYAAKVVYSLIKYKELIDDGQIPVVKMGKNELDNSQFGKVFGTCRIPAVPEDKLEYHPDSEHIVVVYKNHFYKLCVYDDGGKPFHPDKIVSELKNIVKKEKEPGIPFGILSTDQRDNWANAYAHLNKFEENQKSLQEIQSCLFTLSLDENVSLEGCNKLNILSEQLLHGGGSKCNSSNRWMDKTIQVIVNPNGLSGFTYEHSPAEGQPIALMTDYVTCNLNNREHYEGASSAPATTAQKLELKSNDCVETYIPKAKRNLDQLARNLHCHVLQFKGYGKGFCKKQKLSPDSFIQIALQFAYYKLHRKPAAQYESAHLRIYEGGRTETIRSCSVESMAFAKAMCDTDMNDCKRAELLREAVESHRKYTSLALQGRGVDRHLLGLKLMAIENKLPIPKLYSTPGYMKSNYFRVSTSQVATPNLAFMCYGPSVKDGYACCYNPREDDLLLALSSWRDCEETNAERFSKTLEQVFCEMKHVLSVAGEKPKSKL